MVPKNEPDESATVVKAITEVTDEDQALYDAVRENPNFVREAMEKAYDPKINMVRDLTLDDSEFPFAENIFDYYNRVVGGETNMMYSRQMWLSLFLLNEVCPYCTPKKLQIMENVPVDLAAEHMVHDMTLFKHGVCHKCNHTLQDAIDDRLVRDYTEAVWVLGQRSGKSTTTAGIATYIFHRYLMSPKLASNKGIGIQAATPLQATFVATTYEGAHRLLWKPTRDTMNGSDWYRDYFAFLDEKGRHMGKEFYKFPRAGGHFRAFHKSFEATPEGPSKRNLRGSTRLLAGTDELGHFPYNPLKDGEDGEDSTREHADGNEVHQVMDTSLLTVRGAVMLLRKRGIFTYPMALQMSVSSPSSWQDKVMRLYKDGQKADSAIQAVRAPTWEITPIFPRHHPWVMSQYARNPKKAERDLGANPPRLGAEMFDRKSLQEIFDGKPNRHRIVYDNIQGFTRGKAIEMYEPALLPPSVLVLDAGLTNNAFAVAVMHRITPLDGEPQFLDHFRASTVLEVVPTDETRVDFVYVFENVVRKLIAENNIGVVISDRWQNVMMTRQIEIESKGRVLAIEHRINAKESDAFSSTVFAQQLHLPKTDIEFDRAEASETWKTDLLAHPVGHVYRQFLTVQPAGGILTKGENSTDDMFRCLMLGSTALMAPKVIRHMKNMRHIERRPSVGQLSGVLVVGGRSSTRRANPFLG